MTKDAIILHCPGPLRRRGGKFHDEWRNTCELMLSGSRLRGQASALDGVTIVTYSNRPEKTLLERCLEHFGFENFVVLGKNVGPWTHRYKITLVLEYLESGACPTDTILCLDADDSLIVNDPRLIPDRLRGAQCKVLFGNTGIDAPPCPECCEFEDSVPEYTDEWHRHLNAGGFIGDWRFIAARMREILELSRTDPAKCQGRNGFDDQLAWRYMHKKYYPDVKIDAACRIFLRFDEAR